MDGLSFQKILQCGYCIFILNPSCLHCHPCGLPSDDDLQEWRNVIHLPAIDQSNLSPSLFDSPKKPPPSYILLWFIPLICTFYLSRYYESCVFLHLALLGKLVSIFADALYLGLCTIGRDWTYYMWVFAFLYSSFDVSLFFFAAEFALMQVGLASLNTYIWILLRSSWDLKLSSLRYTFLSCWKTGWMKKVIEYYGDSFLTGDIFVIGILK